MPVPVDVKRAALRELYSSAVTQATATLAAALAVAIAPSLKATLAGKQVIEAQAEGIVTKYQLPATLAGGSPDLAAMWSQLQDLYDLAVSPTGGALAAETQNLPHAAGAAIYAWMMDRLKPVRAFGPDHTNPGFRS